MKHKVNICSFIVAIFFVFLGCNNNQLTDEERRIYRLGNILNFCLKNKSDDLTIFRTFQAGGRSYDARNQRYNVYISEYDRDSVLIFPNVILYPDEVYILLNQNDSEIKDEYKLRQKHSIEYWGKREKFSNKDSLANFLTTYLKKRINKYYNLGIYNVIGKDDVIVFDLLEGGGFDNRVYLFPNGVETVRNSNDLFNSDVKNYFKIGGFYFKNSY